MRIGVSHRFDGKDAGMTHTQEVDHEALEFERQQSEVRGWK